MQWEVIPYQWLGQMFLWVKERRVHIGRSDTEKTPSRIHTTQSDTCSCCTNLSLKPLWSNLFPSFWLLFLSVIERISFRLTREMLVLFIVPAPRLYFCRLCSLPFWATDDTNLLLYLLFLSLSLEQKQTTLKSNKYECITQTYIYKKITSLCNTTVQLMSCMQHKNSQMYVVGAMYERSICLN